MRHLKYFKKTIVHASILSGCLDLCWIFDVFAPYFRACAFFCCNSTIYTTYAIFAFCAILWLSDSFADFADFVDFLVFIQANRLFFGILYSVLRY